MNIFHKTHLFVSRFMNHHWRWIFIFISLIITLLLKYFIARMTFDEKIFSTSLNLKNLNNNFVIVNTEPVRVYFKLSAKIEFLNQKNIDEKISAVVDMSQAKPGKNDYPIEYIIEGRKEGMIINSITEKATITLDETIEKTVPLNHVLNFTAEEGFIVEDIEYLPDEALIKGPSMKLSRIDEINAETSRLGEIKESKEISLKIRRPEGVTLIEPEYFTLKITVISNKPYWEAVRNKTNESTNLNGISSPISN